VANGDGNRLMEPARYRIETKARGSAILALAGVALVLIFAVLPAFAGRGLIQDLIFVFYMLALAQCWNLLAGYAGLVSVGQQAFVGAGQGRSGQGRADRAFMRGFSATLFSVFCLCRRSPDHARRIKCLSFSARRDRLRCIKERVRSVMKI
jgi:hypothetical protein